MGFLAVIGGGVVVEMVSVVLGVDVKKLDETRLERVKS